MRRWAVRPAKLAAALLTILLVLHMLSEPGLGQQPGPLILVWNGYQEKDALWAVVMERVTGGECAARCRVTRDRGRQSEAAAILFHLPNLHWEGYRYPARRDLTVPWILMTYESANSVRERAANWGRFPALTGKHINNVFNRTVSFRRDSDVVVRHGVVSRRVQPLTPAQLQRAYSGQQSRDFSNYTAGNAEPDSSPQQKTSSWQKTSRQGKWAAWPQSSGLSLTARTTMAE